MLGAGCRWEAAPASLVATATVYPTPAITIKPRRTESSVSTAPSARTMSAGMSRAQDAPGLGARHEGIESRTTSRTPLYLPHNRHLKDRGRPSTTSTLCSAVRMLGRLPPVLWLGRQPRGSAVPVGAARRRAARRRTARQSRDSEPSPEGSLWRLGGLLAAPRRYSRIVGYVQRRHLEVVRGAKDGLGPVCAVEGVCVADAQDEADAPLGASAVWEPRGRVIQRSQHAVGPGQQQGVVLEVGVGVHDDPSED